MRFSLKGTPNLVKAPECSRNLINAGNAFFGSPRLATRQSGSRKSGMLSLRR
jgi:hypothetical protein